ncbi:MAG TPA: AmmeMemoRadiSam system protein B, partial [Polyangiaceae bacterium]|nr:AmmeMemoRadiSam system protein B [Polyangiaceae bacterium]
MDRLSRPALRPVESIVVPDREHGRVLILRDTQGVTDAHAVIQPVLASVVARFAGRQTCEEIAVEASAEVGTVIPIDIVVRLAAELERGLFLEGPVFRAARARVERDFADAPLRPATHAGGAYYGEREALEKYIDEACLAKARGGVKRANGSGATRPSRPNGPSGPHEANGRANGGAPPSGILRALIAPHIDPWRGAVGYGHAYGALAAAVPDDADVFVLLGTSHAPMREPFALCRKAFDTPLGAVPADEGAIDALAARASGFDPFADQFNHKREHSLEFQVVFLKHILRDRPFRIVPVLAGLGSHQSTGRDPAGDAGVAGFMGGIRDLIESRPGRVVLVAGADLAHVGPRFGDPKAFGDDERATLE